MKWCAGVAKAAEQMRRKPARTAARREKQRRIEAAETARFNNRLRFDQSVFWNWNRPPELISTPSTCAPMQEFLALWGAPYERGEASMDEIFRFDVHHGRRLVPMSTQ